MIALAAALAAVAFMWCTFTSEIDELKQSQTTDERSRLITEVYLSDQWASDDYLIFEDGTVISTKTFEQVFKLDVSHIVPMDGGLCLSGDYVAVHDGVENINLYDLSKGMLTSSIKVPATDYFYNFMNLSPCGRYLIHWAGEDNASVYDMTTGDILREIPADYVLSEYHFSAGGKYIYLVEYQDAHSGWVELISLESPSRDRTVDFEGRLCPIDEGGNFLVDIEDDTVLELSTGRWYQVEIDGYFEFSSSGQFLAVETPVNVLRVYDTQTWDVVMEESFVNHSGTIFIDDDRYMLTCHYPDEQFEGDQTANVYDTRTWTLVNTLYIESWIEDLRNLKSTYVYDPINQNIVDVLTARSLFTPYYFDDVEILDVKGSVMTMLQRTYDELRCSSRLLVFDLDTGEHYVNAHISEGVSHILISDNNEFLICSVSGTYLFTFEDFVHITRIICD